jgi:transposase
MHIKNPPQGIGNGPRRGGKPMWPDLEKLSIHIRPGKTDMRKQIDGLSAMVELSMGKRPFTGDLFLFCGRNGTMIKALYWDRIGFCLWTKRLEKGRFPWPRGDEPVAQLTREEIDMILDGIDFRKRFKPLEYSRIA